MDSKFKPSTLFFLLEGIKVFPFRILSFHGDDHDDVSALAFFFLLVKLVRF